MAETKISDKAAYQKQYRAKNGELVNDKQRSYRTQKRLKKAQYLRDALIEDGMGTKDSKTFNSMLVFLFMLNTGITRPYYIAHGLALPYDLVCEFITNWAKSTLWDHKEKCFNLDECETPFEHNTQISLVGLVGSGEIVANRMIVDK